jgi:hypothetical protein
VTVHAWRLLECAVSVAAFGAWVAVMVTGSWWALGLFAGLAVVLVAVVVSGPQRR